MPDTGARIVVVNTTPVLSLAIIDHLWLLKDLYVQSGRVNLLRPLVDRMISGGVWIAGDLLAETLKLAGE